MLSNFKINMIQSLKGMVNDIRILTQAKIFKDYFGKILYVRQKQSDYNGYYNIHVLYNDKQALLLFYLNCPTCSRKLLTNPG